MPEFKQNAIEYSHDSIYIWLSVLKAYCTISNCTFHVLVYLSLLEIELNLSFKSYNKINGNGALLIDNMCFKVKIL